LRPGGKGDRETAKLTQSKPEAGAAENAYLVKQERSLQEKKFLIKECQKGEPNKKWGKYGWLLANQLVNQEQEVGKRNGSFHMFGK